MASTYTVNLGLRKPENRDPETYDSWDRVLNNNFDIIDTVLGKRVYTQQNYIRNSDTYAQSLDKLDVKLREIEYKQNLVVQEFLVEDILFAEYAGAVLFSPSSNNEGELVTDAEVIDNRVFTYYQWKSGEATLQSYGIYVQWKVPNRFKRWSELALAVDVKTQVNNDAQCKVDVEIQKDGNATTSSVSERTTNGIWAAVRLNNPIIGFSSDDQVLRNIVAGDILNVKIVLSSRSNNFARVGAVTIRYIVSNTN